MKNSLLVIVSCLLLIDCKPSVPRDLIQPDEMADILYDYHLADAIAMEQESDNRGYDSRLYRLAALKKHGVTEAEFDSSMVYYTRHADRLHSNYQKVAERKEKDATALGATVSDLNRKAGIEGEALNIWPGERSLALMPLPLYDHMQYRVEADTTFHKGERFTLGFDTHFLFQDGSRNGIAQLVVRFKNDSIASRIMHVSSNGHYDLEILDKGKRGVDTIEALFYIGSNQISSEAGSTTTLKLMVVDNIKLLKVKMEEQKKEDSQVNSSRDSTDNKPRIEEQELKEEDSLGNAHRLRKDKHLELNAQPKELQVR